MKIKNEVVTVSQRWGFWDETEYAVFVGSIEVSCYSKKPSAKMVKRDAIRFLSGCGHCLNVGDFSNHPHF
nr:MAG TPA: UL49 family protein [Caudoviricetes sp.]